MLVPNQMISIKWGRTNKAHYVSKGYTFTKIGDTFEVHAEDLMRGSSAAVKVICDECGCECITLYKAYIKSLELHPNKYYCRTCVQKTEQTRNTIESAIQEKYGVKNCAQLQEFKDKAKSTNLAKRGVEYPTQSLEVKAKIKKTFEQNGTLCGFQNKERRIKAQQTLAASGKAPVSLQQKTLFEQLSEYYSQAEICELNHGLDVLSLDIVLQLDGIMIDIEVDGEYWHKDIAKDRRRDEVVKKAGYKVLRIRFVREMPEFNIIVNGINKLISSDHTFYGINTEDCQYKYNNNN